MKQILILMTLASSASVAGFISPTEITNMVSKIKKERVGIDLAKLENTSNPFIIHVPVEKPAEEIKEEAPLAIVPTEVAYTLKAILNKAAFINKKWYKQGDTLGTYTVGYVSSDSVVIQNSAGKRVLKLDDKKKNLIKLNRGYK